jgi:hypothetical protein
MAELVKLKHFDIVLEANRLRADNAEAVAAWCGGVLVVEHHALNHDITYPGINVPTSWGMRRAQEEDWIIKLGPDSFTVVSPTEFWTRYEMAVIDG